MVVCVSLCACRAGPGTWGPQGRREEDQPPGYSEFNPDANVDELFEKHINTGIDFDKYGELPVETYGEDIPPEMPTFGEMGLPFWLADNVRNRVGWARPTPIQRRAIPCVLAKRHVMGCAQTGSGKTAAFLFPILMDLASGGGRPTPTGLLLAPTRELVQQIFEEAKKFAFGSPGVVVEAIFGGSRVSDQAWRVRRGCDILIATPGRLMDFLRRDVTRLSKVRFYVLDEADRMLDMGFGPDIRRIMTDFDMPSPKEIQMLMFSATLGPQVSRAQGCPSGMGRQHPEPGVCLKGRALWGPTKSSYKAVGAHCKIGWGGSHWRLEKRGGWYWGCGRAFG